MLFSKIGWRRYHFVKPYRKLLEKMGFIWHRGGGRNFF
jgi:hypothetical protein